MSLIIRLIAVLLVGALARWIEFDIESTVLSSPGRSVIELPAVPAA